MRDYTTSLAESNELLAGLDDPYGWIIETTRGVMGDDSPSGANNGWAVTSGKLSAESIAAALGAAEEDAAA